MERENERTREGLPVVTKKIYKSFLEETARNIRMKDYESCLNDMLEEIYSENRTLHEYIVHTASIFPSFINGNVAIFAASIYKILKSQAGNELVDEKWFPRECDVEGISFSVPSELVKTLGWGDGDDLEGEINEDSLIIKRRKNDKSPKQKYL